MALRAAVVTKRNLFTSKRNAIRTTTVQAPSIGVAELLTRCRAVLPVSAFDREPLAFTDVEDSFLAYAEDLQAMLVALRKDVDARVLAATDALNAHDAALDAPSRLRALEGGAESIFGEGFQLIPTFALPAAFAAEQTQAQTAFTSGATCAKSSQISCPTRKWPSAVSTACLQSM